MEGRGIADRGEETNKRKRWEIQKEE